MKNIKNENKIFRNDDRPDCYKRVRYIRDCCKVFSDLSKNEKDFVSYLLNKKKKKNKFKKKYF